MAPYPERPSTWEDVEAGQGNLVTATVEGERADVAGDADDVVNQKALVRVSTIADKASRPLLPLIPHVLPVPPPHPPHLLSPRFGIPRPQPSRPFSYAYRKSKRMRGGRCAEEARAASRGGGAHPPHSPPFLPPLYPLPPSHFSPDTEQAIFLRLSEIEEGERRKVRKRRALLAGGAALILLALLIAAAVAIGVTASKKKCQESADQSSNATSADAMLTQQQQEQQEGELVGTVQIGGRWGNVSTVVAKLDIQPNTNGVISANGGGATSSWDAATWQPSGGAVEDTSAVQQLANPELTPVDGRVFGMGVDSGTTDPRIAALIKPPDLSVQGVDFQNGHLSVSGPDSWSFSLEPFKEVSLDLTALINVAAVVSNPNPIEIIAQEVNMDVSFYSVDVGYANIPDFTLPANSSATITVPFNIDNFPLLSFSDQSLITGSIANGELEFQVGEWAG
ncbi:unnamed protein product [Closterium sp. Naga37s-1]|nr:unnamed protein product [Closterium sp. Naga37s-1]